jgi:hypothetical protein
MPNAEFESAVQAEASARAFLARCEDVRSQGVERYGEKKFNEAMTAFQSRGGLDDPTLKIIIEGADDPTAAVMALASNPDEHQRILKLPPAARVMSAFRLATKTTRPAGENPGTPAEKLEPWPAGPLNDKLSDEDWYRIRAEQKRRPRT